MENARKVTYRERRPGGWSETLYTGLLVWMTNGHHVLVIESPHGLRVLPFNQENVKFEGDESRFWVKISEDYYQIIMRAFEADQELQKCLTEHNKILSQYSFS